MVNASDFDAQYANLVAQLRSFDRSQRPDFDSRLAALQTAWNQMQASVASTNKVSGTASATGRAFNALITAIKQSGGVMQKDLAAAIREYVLIVERLFSTKVGEENCDVGGCATPAVVKPPPPAANAPIVYWWESQFKRTNGGSGPGTYARTTVGNYKIVTPVPTNYWPQNGPTGDDRLNSAGPNAVYTPTIHRGVTSLVTDIATSVKTIKDIKDAIEALHAVDRLCDSTLTEIEHNKDAVIQALASDPSGNFTFRKPSVDWLSYDGQLRVRLSA